MGDLQGRLRRHAYKLPEGYYNDEDFGCSADDPESLIMATLDSGPIGTHVMEVLTAYDFIIVETAAIDAALAERDHLLAEIAQIREAGQQVIERASSTYKARNGRTMSIQGDDGEACLIVHSDDFYALRAALQPPETPAGEGI